MCTTHRSALLYAYIMLFYAFVNICAFLVMFWFNTEPEWILLYKLMVDFILIPSSLLLTIAIHQDNLSIVLISEIAYLSAAFGNLLHTVMSVMIFLRDNEYGLPFYIFIATRVLFFCLFFYGMYAMRRHISSECLIRCKQMMNAKNRGRCKDVITRPTRPPAEGGPGHAGRSDGMSKTSFIAPICKERPPQGYDPARNVTYNLPRVVGPYELRDTSQYICAPLRDTTTGTSTIAKRGGVAISKYTQPQYAEGRNLSVNYEPEMPKDCVNLSNPTTKDLVSKGGSVGGSSGLRRSESAGGANSLRRSGSASTVPRRSTATRGSEPQQNDDLSVSGANDMNSRRSTAFRPSEPQQNDELSSVGGPNDNNSRRSPAFRPSEPQQYEDGMPNVSVSYGNLNDERTRESIDGSGGGRSRGGTVGKTPSKSSLGRGSTATADLPIKAYTHSPRQPQVYSPFMKTEERFGSQNYPATDFPRGEGPVVRPPIDYPPFSTPHGACTIGTEIQPAYGMVHRVSDQCRETLRRHDSLSLGDRIKCPDKVFKDASSSTKLTTTRAEYIQTDALPEVRRSEPTPMVPAESLPPTRKSDPCILPLPTGYEENMDRILGNRCLTQNVTESVATIGEEGPCPPRRGRSEQRLRRVRGANIGFV